MLDLLKWALEWVRSLPWWRPVEPYIAVISLGAVGAWAWREYLESTYQLTLPLEVFVRSYAVTAIAVVVFAVLVAVAVAQLTRRWRLLVRLTVIGVALCFALSLIFYVRPKGVGNITVKFIDEPTFDANAVTYLIYELNKLQRTWYLDVDFDVFNPAVLTSQQRARCESAEDPMCWPDVLSDGRPMIALTTQDLGEHSFSINRGNVSLISTYRWQDDRPPNVYEFIIFSTIVESVLIHLNTSCTGLPRDAFRVGSRARGSIFEFAPRRGAFKAVVLAGHMSRSDEALLLNCFGGEYLANIAKLLSLDWMRRGPVRENLEKSFGITM